MICPRKRARISFHCAAGSSGTDPRRLAAHGGKAAYPRVPTASLPAVIPCRAPPAHMSNLETAFKSEFIELALGPNL